jgi:type IV secretion system protein VirD4
MNPKKKSIFAPLLALIGLFASTYAAILAALAFEDIAIANPDATKTDWSQVSSRWLERVQDAPFDLAVNAYTLNSLMIIGGAYLLVVMMIASESSRRARFIRGKEHGTAAWGARRHIIDLLANSRENRKLVKKELRNDSECILTASERICIYNRKLNNNVLIMGGSGSGKTRGFVMPNILQAHSSFVVTDPKGEILEKSGNFLIGRGFKIRVLNLDNKALSDGYNPFVYIHPNRDGYEERVLMLIEAIILNSDGGKKRESSDPFWEKAERLFLQAIFFFTCDGFLEDERNMNTVLELIGMLELAEEDDKLDSDLDQFAKMFKEAHGADHIGAQQFTEFRSKASGKTAKSIVISAVARLAPFRTKAVKRIFSYDTMEIDRLGEEMMAIFVVVPPTDGTFNFIAGMLFTQMFQELQYCATEVHKHHGQRLPIPVRFVLDEFANTCTIPNFVKILAYARSFGIGIVPILQSLEQIKHMYEKEWGVIVDNCNALLFLGSITHNDTLKYISELLGKGTFLKQSYGRSRGKSGGSSTNTDTLGRELMMPDELRQLPKEECILILSGRPPFRGLKYDYTKHPNYRYTSDADVNNSFSYLPTKPSAPESQSLPAASAASLKGKKKKDPVVDKGGLGGEPAISPVSGANLLANLKVKALTNGLSPITDELMTTDEGESGGAGIETVGEKAFLAHLKAKDTESSFTPIQNAYMLTDGEELEDDGKWDSKASDEPELIGEGLNALIDRHA